MTFVLGPHAAEAVGRQIGSGERFRTSQPRLWQRRIDDLGGLFERYLRRWPRGFCLDLGGVMPSRLRLVWEGFEDQAGLLATEVGILQTVSMLMRTSGPATDQALLRLAELFGGVPQFLPFVAAVGAGKVPLVATFCLGNDFPSAIEQSVLSFASVFFSVPAAPADTPALSPSPRAPASSSRGRGW
jgi:hypothetical protein